MHLLFIGYSNLVRKRILPVLSQLDFISKISIAKFQGQNWDNDFSAVDFTRYDNFDSAINNCNPDLVYISTVNSAHYSCAITWLNKKCHVIIDKPAALSLTDAERMVNLAKKNKVLLAEATVYLFHNQMNEINNIFKQHHDWPKFITAHFSFPPLNPDNFRYSLSLGGGALFDTAAYCVSVGRFFYNSLPLSVTAIGNEYDKNGLDLSYSVLFSYNEGRSMIGHFGFTTEYINRLTVLGNSTLVDVDRVFTIPDNVENILNVRSRNNSQVIKVKAENTFVNFFKAVQNAINTNSYDFFYDALIMDAFVLTKLLNQIKKKDGN